MLLKDKIKMIFLTIITFGLIWIKWTKMKNSNLENSFYVANKLPFKMEQFYAIIPKESILSISNTHIRTNITVADASKVAIEELQKLKNVTGVVVMSNKISLVLNEYAPVLAQELLKQKGENNV
ncbi:hypothetical protein BLA55_03665 [Mycoplasmopsis pullorum]|uniref:PTS glucose transporter subunit IIB n=2 Tax=Mycoplasmopsis pullorum TaxID=48003 RepID=A0A1L4FSX9_9BACT|nr:hypothetical protein BLA55_03665 [Mycoplasmopsis pullorum]